MFDNLPEICYSTLNTTGETIIIKRGESGYYRTDYKAKADKLNKQLEVTKAQEQAMKIGSMFGWNVPGANPKIYDEKGGPKREEATI